MTPNPCSFEAELMDALRSGRWPEACSAELHEHVGACGDCRELALVAEALLTDRRESDAAASVPPSGAVWWRMQMRMEREASDAAARTVRRAHSAVVAATIGALGLVLATTSLPGSAWAWLESAMPDRNALAALATAPSPLTMILLAAIPFVVLAPVAFYLAVREE